LGGVTKESERDPAQATCASLITIEQPGASDPVSPMVLVGELQYLGVEDIEAASRTWRAYKFSIRVPLHPEYLVWTSAKGLLLALSVEHAHAGWPKEGLRLARCRLATGEGRGAYQTVDNIGLAYWQAPSLADASILYDSYRCRGRRGLSQIH
jgi:hypothetical protein